MTRSPVTRRSQFDHEAAEESARILDERYGHIKKRSARAIAFIEGECIVPSGRGAGKRYKLAPFQKRLLRKTLDGPLVAIWSLARGAGKSGLAAALLVFFLYDALGARVVAASTALRTARISFDRSIRIIEANPLLMAQAMIHRNAADPYVELLDRGSTLQPLPAEERFVVGEAPALVLVDEVGYVRTDTFEVLQSALGKIEGCLLLGVGTPGLGVPSPEENVMYRYRTMEDRPDGLLFLEFAASPDDDPSRPATWKKANPGLGVFLDPKAVAMDFATLSLSKFQQMRLGLWTQSEHAWIDADDWRALPVVAGRPEEGTSVALGFDGSSSRDGTALMALELATGRLCVLGYWEPPKGQAAKGWRIPRAEVMATIERAFEGLHVTWLFGDPWGWRSELEELAARYPGRVLEWNTAAQARMAPASDDFLTAVRTGALSHDGNADLTAHVLSATAKATPAGEVIVKDSRKPQRIDLAIASILALAASRAEEYVEVQPQIFF